MYIYLRSQSWFLSRPTKVEVWFSPDSHWMNYLYPHPHGPNGGTALHFDLLTCLVYFM